MSVYPFDCLLVSSRDSDLDTVVAQLLADRAHRVQHVRMADVLDMLHGRTRPAVVIKNLDAPSAPFVRAVLATAAAHEVTRRHGYVLLTLYREWAPTLVPHLPTDHDVTLLALPEHLAQVAPTVEQVGRRVAGRWEPASW
jgi:hypothetical protein